MTTRTTTEEEIKRKFTEQLPCALTDSDLAQIARAIGGKRHEIQDLEAKKRQATDHYKALIDGAQAKADELAEAARAGVEQREVLCVEAFVWRSGKVVVRRDDTGEVVRERAMTVEERQAGMPWAAPDVKQAEPTKGKRKAKGIPLLPAAEHDRKHAKDAEDGTAITDPGTILDGMPPEEPKPKGKRGKKGSRR